MHNRTKQALGTSLKELLQEKNLEKITISELTNRCGLSRMTFYYYFRDIYDLVEWVCIEDLTAALEKNKPYKTWQDGLLNIFDAVYAEKTLTANINRSVSREKIEKFWLEQAGRLIRDVVEEYAKGCNLPPEKIDFITDFYKFAFVGILLEWFDQGMRADYVQIVNDISTIMQGNIENAVRNFGDTML